MSDLFLLSQLATEAMDNENFRETMARNQGPSPTTTGVTTRNQGPSPITTGILPTPGQRPFVFDSSLQQAASVTPVTTQEETRQETAQNWHTGRFPVGGTGTFRSLATNVDQVNREDQEGQAKARSISIPSFALDGKFTKACLHLGRSENWTKTANTTHQLFTAWFSEDAAIGRSERIQRIGDQLAPFPMLAVNGSDNTVCVIHGVKKFTAAFGTRHPNEGNPVSHPAHASILE